MYFLREKQPTTPIQLKDSSVILKQTREKKGVWVLRDKLILLTSIFMFQGKICN